MTNILYFYRVFRDAYTDSSSSQGGDTPQTSQRHKGEASTTYPVSDTEEEDLSEGESDISSYSIPTTFSTLKKFTFEELAMATSYSLNSEELTANDKSDRVYNGWVHKTTLVAVSSETGIRIDVILLAKGEQLVDTEGWVREVRYLQQLSHPNLVRLFGYCLHNERQLLVYEGMPYNLKADYLDVESVHALPWSIMIQIALGAAKGLAFLHRAQVIYRNFRASHVHLDTNCNARLSDFGLSKNHTPEYSDTSTGRFTAMTDVYSFGVLLLEILSGRQASDLVKWAMPYLQSDFMHVLDENLKAQYPLEGVEKVANLTLQCLEEKTGMDKVIQRLQRLQSRLPKKNKKLHDSRYMEFTLGGEMVRKKKLPDSRSLEFTRSGEMVATRRPSWSQYATEDEQESEYFEDGR